MTYLSEHDVGEGSGEQGGVVGQVEEAREVVVVREHPQHADVTEALPLDTGREKAIQIVLLISTDQSTQEVIKMNTV